MDGYRVDYIEGLYLAEGVSPDDAHERAVEFCRRMRTYDRDRRAFAQHSNDCVRELWWWLLPDRSGPGQQSLISRHHDTEWLDDGRERQAMRRKRGHKLKKVQPSAKNDAK